MSGALLDLNVVGHSRFSGFFRVKGTITKLGAVGKYRVRLFEKSTGIMIAQNWSDATTGAYAFNYIPYLVNGFFVIAHDKEDDPLNAAIADLVTPEPMP